MQKALLAIWPALLIVLLAVTDGAGWGHADWTEATITIWGGHRMHLDDLKHGLIPHAAPRYPFSFVYGERESDEILEKWPKKSETKTLDADRTRITTSWTDPDTGLRVHWEILRYADYPAVEWMLSFENTGGRDTDILQQIQAMDITLRSPNGNPIPYRLHKCRGGTPDAKHFEPAVVALDEEHIDTIGSGTGRTSTNNLPFFKIEAGVNSYVVGLGWTGCWQAGFECLDGRSLRMIAGMEKTYFRLHPGEKVRMPRILILSWHGDTLESNAQFRQLIYKHYAARRNGERILPYLFCNTCFTRGGVWLNECNAENQISLIHAYGKLGLEALITDAGWFEGGWPAGAGNWTPRKDAYPDGIEPVAAAAKENNMIYGLWFEPERVVPGTGVHKEHPDWCLSRLKEGQSTFLLDMRNPGARDYFFQIVQGFMQMPGFRFYRQDFNMDPLPYWRFNDPPDRQGICEIKYLEGLYAYWDCLAEAWPDGTREGCASGGHRIDLETIMRFHFHQKTDYWFDNEVDQASLWGVSQYLPNNVIVSHLNRLDDYSFHSNLPATLCLGWIADAPDFDMERGKKLMGTYFRVRHLLIGAWYPLLPYSRHLNDWIASQYHRPDLDEGIVLAFRRPQSPYGSVDLALHGLIAAATYEVTFDSTGWASRMTGAELAKKLHVNLPEAHRSEMIHYRKVGE